MLANVSTVACFGDLTDRAIATFADRFWGGVRRRGGASVTSASTILGGASVEPGSVGGKVFALNRLIEMGASAPPTG